ncbi:hypothetical protein FRB93_007925 [Tulasnella sp. JGI-2019a]|nr:hypothetical protein FRB93_007925 [Tulasnella sp. JGI-2019a]
MRSFDRALDIFIDGLHRLRSAKARQHNALLPISHLPNELLVKIFALVSTGKDQLTRLYGLATGRYSPNNRMSGIRLTVAELALVCQEWREILHITPSLWVNIRSDHPRQAYLECLARSGNVPLHIFANELGVHNTKARQEFRERICHEVHRWQSVEISVMSMDLLKELERLPAPLLERLTIRYEGIAVRDSGPTSLFCGSASKLRHATLINVRLPWMTDILAGLKTLDISNVRAASPSAQQVVHVLRSCPDLTSLKLHIWSESDLGPIPPNTLTIDLPRLEHLSIAVHPLMTQNLLQRVRIPMCKTLRVDHDKPTGPTFSAETKHLIPCLSSMLCTTSQLTIRLAAATLQYEATGQTTEADGQSVQCICINSSNNRFTRNNDNNYALETLSWLLDNIHTLSFSSPVFLHISDINSPHVIMSIMDQLSSVVTELHLALTDISSKFILSYLAEPVKLGVGSSATLKWPLPNLKELSVEWCHNLSPEVVLTCVQRRAGRGPGGRADREELPITLSKLVLPEGSSTATILRMFPDCMEWSGLRPNPRVEDLYGDNYSDLYVDDDDDYDDYDTRYGGYDGWADSD